MTALIYGEPDLMPAGKFKNRPPMLQTKDSNMARR
jgi:hypothetical protein